MNTLDWVLLFGLLFPIVGIFWLAFIAVGIYLYRGLFK